MPMFENIEYEYNDLTSKKNIIKESIVPVIYLCWLPAFESIMCSTQSHMERLSFRYEVEDRDRDDILEIEFFTSQAVFFNGIINSDKHLQGQNDVAGILGNENASY
ncbi:hypothetical protein Tco_1491364 [Tanacetum coccineum]